MSGRAAAAAHRAIEAVGGFYRGPELADGDSRRAHVTPVSLIVIGCGGLIMVAFIVPFFEPPFGGGYFIYWLCALTVLLEIVAVLRKERGLIGAAAAVVALGAAALAAFGVAFAFGYSWFMRIVMPD
jgi:hypothetical protein